MSRLRTMDFDAIAASAPLDKTASVVRDGMGEHWDPETKVQHWIAPPPTQPVPQNSVDLTSLCVGRLRVLGYFGAGGKWLVRCACGGYETRKGRYLQDPVARGGDHPPMCSKCGTLESLKLKERSLRTGRWPDGRPCDLLGLKTATGARRLKDAEPTP